MQGIQAPGATYFLRCLPSFIARWSENYAARAHFPLARNDVSLSVSPPYHRRRAIQTSYLQDDSYFLLTCTDSIEAICAKIVSIMHLVTKYSLYLLYAGLQACNGLPSQTDSLQVPFIDQAAIASKSQHKAYEIMHFVAHISC